MRQRDPKARAQTLPFAEPDETRGETAAAPNGAREVARARCLR